MPRIATRQEATVRNLRAQRKKNAEMTGRIRKLEVLARVAFALINLLATALQQTPGLRRRKVQAVKVRSARQRSR